MFHVMHAMVPWWGIVFIAIPGFLLSTLISWTDWDAYEIDDRHMVPLLVLGLLWGGLCGFGWCDSLIAALFLGVPVFFSWFFTRGREMQPVAEGDIMLMAAVGAWVGLQHIILFFVATLCTMMLVCITTIPRIYQARQRVARGETAEFKGKYRPTQYNAVPMAPVVILAAWIDLAITYLF